MKKLEKKHKEINQLKEDDENLFQQENEDDLYKITDGADLIVSEVTKTQKRRIESNKK